MILLILLEKQRRDKKTEIHYMKTKTNKQVIKALTPKIKTYNPTLWLPGSFLKIIYMSQRPLLSFLEMYIRRKFKLRDGGKVAVDCYPKNFEQMNEDTPIVLFVPGVNGDSTEYYCTYFCRLVKEHHVVWRFAIFNRRGYAGVPFKGKRFGFDAHEDINEVIEAFSKEYPKANIYIVALSLGGANTMKCLEIYGKRVKVKAVTAIATPWNFRVGSTTLIENQFFDRALTSRVVEVHRKHLHEPYFLKLLKSKKIAPTAYNEIESKHDLDRLIMAVDAGQQDLESYNDYMSTDKGVAEIRVPFLSIHSKDDLLSPFAGVPVQEVVDNGRGIQIATNGGGHVSFFSGLGAKMWGLELAFEYFRLFEEGLVSYEGNQGLESSPVFDRLKGSGDDEI